MLKHLKDIFFTILIYLLFATVTPNILEYIWISVKLFLPFQIYTQPLNCLNLEYIISLIHKFRFKDLDFLIPSEVATSKISKIIIFVHKLDKSIKIAKYLCLRLYKQYYIYIHNKSYQFVQDQIFGRSPLK